MRGSSGLGRVLVVLVAVIVGLSGCSSSVNRAPIEERGTASGTWAPATPVVVQTAVQQPPGFENAGKPGYYTVKPGDTMTRIGLDTGQSWRDIARWNGLTNPNLIEVGQVLRVVPPPVAPVPIASVVPAAKNATAVPAAVVASAPAATGATASAVPSSTVTTTAVAPTTVTATPVPPVQSGSNAPASAAAAVEEDTSMIWPASGGVLAGFDEVKNKGLDIGGSAGDPVLAAADGRVVYVGASLRGYGNLIILKHNNTYLTAYAHNQVLLVKEDQTVRKGQKIAEMGSSDTDRIKLHFEVRRQGKPVDPVKYLPPR